MADPETSNVVIQVLHEPSDNEQDTLPRCHVQTVSFGEQH